MPLLVIVADDNEDTCELLGLWLINIGFQHAGLDVRQCTNGLQVESLVRARPQDVALLITDLTMPGRTGFELIPLVRAQAPQASIVIFSGEDSNGTHNLPEPGAKGGFPTPEAT